MKNLMYSQETKSWTKQPFGKHSWIHESIILTIYAYLLRHYLHLNLRYFENLVRYKIYFIMKIILILYIMCIVQCNQYL